MHVIAIGHLGRVAHLTATQWQFMIATGLILLIFTVTTFTAIRQSAHRGRFPEVGDVLAAGMHGARAQGGNAAADGVRNVDGTCWIEADERSSPKPNSAGTHGLYAGTVDTPRWRLPPLRLGIVTRRTGRGR